jgi:hypothetical protein
MITAQKKKDEKAMRENKRQDTKTIMKMEKQMIFLVVFGGLCIRRNITGRKF